MTNTIPVMKEITKITTTITSTGSPIDSVVNMPTGFTRANSCILGVGYSTSDDYRHGNNAFGIGERVFARLTSNNTVIVTSNYNGTINVEVILGRV